MASNLKLLCDASSQSVDAMMYLQMIGSLMYLMNTILDISFSMNTLSQFLTDLRHVHLVVAKHIVRYMKGIVEYGLNYDMSQKTDLHGYVDSIMYPQKFGSFMYLKNKRAYISFVVNTAIQFLTDLR